VYSAFAVPAAIAVKAKSARRDEREEVDFVFM
jgi:hypothetical protein